MMNDLLDDAKPKIMKKEMKLLLVCETGKFCLDPIKDGVPHLNVQICLACDFAQIELLGIEDYVEKPDEKKPLEEPKEETVQQPANPSQETP